MTFPTTDILDGFERSDEGPPPSASWGAKIVSAQSGLVVSSNTLTSASGIGSQVWGTEFGPDCEIYCDVPFTDSNSFALYVRLKDLGTTFDGYCARFATGDGQVVIQRWDNGAPTGLGFIGGIDVLDGDTVGVRVTGNVISAFHKPSGGVWTLVLERTDSTYPDAGFIGVQIFSSSVQLDNLGGGDSVFPITGVSLFRGRGFPAFDDEEINRFEFWPAVVVATVHERAATVDATASIATSATFFSVFQRASAVDASGSITTTSQRVCERSASLDASVTVSAVGARVVERAAAISSTAAISVTGESFRVFESATTLAVAAGVASSGVAFSVSESSASISAAASIAISGTRVVERAASVTTSVTIESSAQSFSVTESTVAVGVSGAIESTAEFFSVCERQAAIDGTATITVAHQAELMRQVAISTVVSIAVTGGIEGGAFEHERSAAIDGAGSIVVSAEFFSVFERALDLTGTGTIVVAGAVPQVHQASVLLNAVGSITVSGTFGAVFYPRNLFNTGRESRILGINRESRALPISREGRIV